MQELEAQLAALQQQARSLRPAEIPRAQAGAVLRVSSEALCISMLVT